MKTAQKTHLDKMLEDKNAPNKYRAQPTQTVLPLYDPQWKERQIDEAKKYPTVKNYIPKPEDQIDFEGWFEKKDLIPSKRKPINMDYPELHPEQIKFRPLNERENKRLQGEIDRNENQRRQYENDSWSRKYRQEEYERESEKLTKYKDLDKTLPIEIQTAIIKQYNEFREVAVKFYEKYKEANSFAENVPEISYGGTYKNLVQQFAQFTIAAIKVKIGELFGHINSGKRYHPSSDASNLAEFLQKGIDIFSIHAFNYEAKLYEMQSVIHNMNNIMEEYERMKKILILLPKKVNAAINSFLRTKDNKEFLQWLDQYFPESKEDFVKNSIDELLSDHNSHSDYLQLGDLKNIKSFKKIHDKAIEFSTYNLKNKLKKNVSDEIYDELYKNIKEKIVPKLNYLKLIISPDSAVSFPEFSHIVKKEYGVDLPSILGFANTIIDNHWDRNEAFDSKEEEKDKFYETFLNSLRENVDEILKPNTRYNNHLDTIMKPLHDFVRNWTHGIEMFRLKELSNLSEKDINKLIADMIKNLIIDALPNFKERGYGPPRHSFPDFSSLNPMIKETGRFSISDFTNLAYNAAPFVPKEFWFNLIKQMVKGASTLGIKSLQEFEFIAYLKGSTYKTALEGLVNLLKKHNKFTVDNFVNMFKRHYGDFYKMSSNISSEFKKLSGSEQAKLISDAIRNPETVSQDADNFLTFLRFKHDQAAELDEKSTNKILNNKNFTTFTKNGIARKLIKIYASIKSRGGADAIYKKYSDLIKDLIQRKFISRNFRSNMKFVVDFFNSNEVINPKSELFNKLFETISSLETDLTTIEMGDALKDLIKHYQEKDKNLFDLNLKINDRLRFRVLNGKDPRTLRVGIETNCCQRIGGQAETVARDAFINPLAGILLLEWKNDEGQWVLVSQSYFHYVPRDHGFILDNVERNSENESRSGVDLEAAYAFLAKSIKEKFNNSPRPLKYFLAGKGYSKIDTDDFKSYNLGSRDPRFFASQSTEGSGRNKVYSDFEARNSIDLLTPKKNLINRLHEFEPKNEGLKTAFKINMRKLILRTAMIC